jgi:DHA1 family inner membrane transport protein
MPRLLILFSLVNLVVGTGAFVVGGILDVISADLKVSVSAAGQAMTAYAMSTALLAPLMLVLTRGLSRKHALLLALGLFTLGNLVCAFAAQLWVLLAGRVLMGMGAVFTPIAAGIAVATTEPARRGRALSLVFLGISLSYVVGLPLGAWLGLHHGWQVPVAVVAGFGAAAMLAVAVLVPAQIHSPAAGFAGLGGVLRQPGVRDALLLTLLYFAAIFCVFAYAGPVFTALVPMGPTQLSVTLMLFGCSGVAGTLLGGWANDRFGPERSLQLQLATLGAMMLLVPFTQGQYAALLAVFMAWGAAGFGMMAPQQSRLAAMSPPHAPLLLSLNSSMLYFGTAAGAAVGGAALEHGVPFARLAWVGLPFAVLGWLLLWAGMRARARTDVRAA